jgi:hypothetical protein
VEWRPHRALVITGAALFGVSGFFSALAALSAGAYTAIPLVGPFITAGRLANVPPCSGPLCFNVFQTVGVVVLAALGVVEVTGASILVAGLATKQQVLRSDVALHVVPVPLVMRNGSGLGLAGTF